MPEKQEWKWKTLLTVAMLATASVWPAPAQQAEPLTREPLVLTLPQAVHLAMEHSHRLALARLAVEDSREEKRIARSHFYPRLSNSSSVLHISALQGVVIPAGALTRGTSGAAVPADTVRIDQGASTTYTSGTGLAQPMTQFFRIRAGVRAADADLHSAQLTEQDAEDNISLEVHQFYYSYLIEEARERAAEDAVHAASVSAEEARQSVQHGHLLTNAQLGTQASLLDKQQAVLVSRLHLDDITLKLDDLLGLPLGTSLTLSSADLETPSILPSRSQAMQMVLEKSPAVLKARQELKKAQAGVDAARDAYIPDITGIARYSYQSGLPFFTHNFGTFGASFKFTLFDGGAREARLHDAHVKLSMAQTQLAQLQNDVRIEIAAAYDKEEQLQQLVQVASLALKAHEETMRIEKQRVQVKASLPSAEVTAQSEVASAKVNLLGARLNLYLAQNDIGRLLGMKFQ
ncbi:MULTISPECIES: TolC family protein [Acidobacterium]|uniref:Outer membrane efflux protein family n=1 Tax=Acidobacterium capsulatum (strain ATCC 51196 / DSM 11244 / BCRC 80197 / JCM 7670 / NBRC 15755 / NCIMB 13165 / 161) TaxID=240015 RepID=C1F5D3_ACIC5|nr:MULTISPECIES: TolC family protein [Acidobacterium]ACO34267.1 Outer membrane efflux protein family [Acidobacterium capsulatum ATCC 51196]HCT60028.1 TolC family protein [Acidobacterium sp.]